MVHLHKDGQFAIRRFGLDPMTGDHPLEGAIGRVRQFALRFLPRIAACLWIIFAVCPASYSFEGSSSATGVMAPVGTTGDALPDASAPQIPVTEKGLPVAILKDELRIWTSPVRIRTHDLIWLLPLGAATGVTLATDSMLCAVFLATAPLTKIA
jgi:hypothetical protein